MSNTAFDAAAVYDEGYQAHVNCDGPESNPYPRYSAEWETWAAGFKASEDDLAEDK